MILIKILNYSLIVIKFIEIMNIYIVVKILKLM